LLYVGLSPGTPGLYQINIRVPDLPNGDHEILMGNAPPEGVHHYHEPVVAGRSF
jgi:hypothetical protein